MLALLLNPHIPSVILTLLGTFAPNHPYNRFDPLKVNDHKKFATS